MWRNIVPLLQLMRWDRPIGFMLLLWPTLGALWIAGHGNPPWHLVLIFMAGVAVMRSAGCVINDVADQKFDGYVTRTKNRPLVRGTLSLKAALLLLIGLLSVAFSLMWQLNVQTQWLAVIAALLAIVYPFTKRFTYLPQLILGITWYIGILMSFTMIQQTIPKHGWVLYASMIVWTVVYDTCYALADRTDDVKIGIKSTAILFGPYDKVIIGLLQGLTWGLWLTLGQLLDCSGYYYIALGFVLALFGYQQYLIRHREPQACITAFLNNNWVGAVWFMGVIASKF